MTVNNLLDLYTDYLLVSPTYCRATGLSAVTDNKVGHDKVARLLSGKLDPSTLWWEAKSMAHDVRSSEGLLAIDGSVEPQKHAEPDSLSTWHYGHCRGESVKGANFVGSFYYSPEHGMGLPIGAEYVKRDMEVIDKMGKVVHKSRETKNQMMHRMVKHANFNVSIKYVLADSWFSSSGNMSCITKERRSDFIMPIKSSGVVALGASDKSNGNFISIESLRPEGRTMSVYLKQYDNPVSIKEVFKNGNGSTGTLYPASSVGLDCAALTTIYEKRWKVEGFFRSIKNNAALAKAPAKTVRTQNVHSTASMMAFAKLERLKIRNNKNHYAMKSQIRLAATKTAWEELDKLSISKIDFNKIAA